MLRKIIFDLDGTLVDSRSGIQHAFDTTYLRLFGKKNNVDLRSLIGPPMDVIIKRVEPGISTVKVNQFVNHFIKIYDKEGYKMTSLFPDVASTLTQMSKFELHLCTNKRMVPTAKILDLLRISKFFKSVTTKDSPILFESKSELIAFAMNEHGIKRNEVLHIGDTEGDYVASISQEIKFLHASYGYGEFIKGADRIKTFNEILNKLLDTT